MNEGTTPQPPSAPVFPERDLRNPAVLGWALLVRARQGTAPLSVVYDRDAALLERVLPWNGNGLMSNDPDLHHSKTSQTPAPGGNE